MAPRAGLGLGRRLVRSTPDDREGAQEGRHPVELVAGGAEPEVAKTLGDTLPRLYEQTEEPSP